MRSRNIYLMFFLLVAICSCSVKKSAKFGRLVVSYYNGNDSLLYLISGIRFIPSQRSDDLFPFYADITYQYAGSHPDSASINFTFTSNQKAFKVQSVKINPGNFKTSKVGRFFSQPYKKGLFQHRFSFKIPEKQLHIMFSNSQKVTVTINDSIQYIPASKFSKQAEYCLQQLMFNE